MGQVEYFNLRVYGILLNANRQILVSDEREYDQEFTKFPGGGMELGEGVRDCLIREFAEECNIAIEPVRHIHTTENYIHSSFNNSQLVAIYYEVRAVREADLQLIKIEAMHPTIQPAQVFRWIPLEDFSEDLLTFKVDKIGWQQYAASLNY